MAKKTSVKEAAETVKDVAKNVVENVTEVAEKATKAVEEKAKETEPSVAKSAAETATKATKAAKKTVKKAAETTTAAKKTVKEAAAKATAKTATPDTTVIVQYQSNETDVEAVKERIKSQFIAEGHRASSIKTMNVYIKPEEYSAYYVINEKFSGRVDLF